MTVACATRGYRRNAVLFTGFTPRATLTGHASRSLIGPYTIGPYTRILDRTCIAEPDRSPPQESTAAATSTGHGAPDGPIAKPLPMGDLDRPCPGIASSSDPLRCKWLWAGRQVDY